jgi:hypothetical protein
MMMLPLSIAGWIRESSREREMELGDLMKLLLKVAVGGLC